MRSVSSVNTLQDVKVAKRSLYIQMPVQEVCRNLFLSGWPIDLQLVWYPSIWKV
jgi:hypothetical protein